MASSERLRIAFFGSSLVSAWWNGAATYYRGILSALNDRGYAVTFYEPDAFDRQAHRDLEQAPDYARVVVYEATDDGVRSALRRSMDCDILIKASGVGVFDAYLERACLDLQGPDRLVIFWDVDAPATLDRVHQYPDDAFRELIPQYDLILTYGGGDPVVSAYGKLQARRCVPIYNALDPSTHHAVSPDARFKADLGFLGNRMPDREERVHEFFFKAASLLPHKRFLLGGNGWDDHRPDLANVSWLGHVYTQDHNAFNITPTAVLNISRDSMARYGFSPATRVFEAAGAGACIITDEWDGIEQFLQPGDECLVARNGQDVANLLMSLTHEEAQQIGARAMARVLADHTYDRRSAVVSEALNRAWERSGTVAA